VSEWLPETLLGKTLGPYRIVEELGRGGMAVVFKAHQAALERDLALKVLRPEVAANRELKSRFHREAEAIANLNHPNIVKVLDRGEADGLSYFAMEWIDGPTLKQVLEDAQISADQLFQIAIHTASGLAHAHAQGIIHRDVKPANVLWESETKLTKVVDFGIARVLDPEAFMITLTQVNASLGTVDYMAPEQKVSAGEVDARADTYALGVMLYEMFVGFRPAGRFKLPSEINPSLPTQLDEIVSRCLEPDPKDRYPNMNEVVNDLKRAQSRFGSARYLERDPEGRSLRTSQRRPALQVAPDPPPAHPMTWLIACSALFAGLVALGVAAYVWGPWREANPTATNPLDPADVLPPEDPPDQPDQPDGPKDPPQDPPVEPPDDPKDPPVDPPDDPKDPPVEPPDDPKDPPVDPPDDPKDPPVEPPDDPEDPPAVDLAPLRAKLRAANSQSATIAKLLHLDMARLNGPAERATSALRARPGSAEELHSAEAELRQLIPGLARAALGGLWSELNRGVLPRLKITPPPLGELQSLPDVLAAAQAYTLAESQLRREQLRHAAAGARQTLGKLPEPIDQALARPPDANPETLATYEAARNALLQLGPSPPRQLVAIDQRKSLVVKRTQRVKHRPFLWPNELRLRETNPTGEIVGICPASAQRCAVLLVNRVEAWLTLCGLAGSRRKLLSSRVGVYLDKDTHLVAPAGVDEDGDEAFFVATRDRVQLLTIQKKLRSTRFGEGYGLLTVRDSRVSLRPLEFDGAQTLAGTVLALATDTDGSLYVLTSERVWRWSPTHVARWRSLRGVATGASPALVPVPSGADPGWTTRKALLLPDTAEGRAWGFSFDLTGVQQDDVAFPRARGAAPGRGWSLLLRGDQEFLLYDGRRAVGLHRDRGDSGALGHVDAVTVSGQVVYAVDEDRRRVTAYEPASR